MVGLRIGVLGPLSVSDDGRAVALAPGKQRVLLAHLALAANRSVPLDELAEALWDGAAPAAAELTLRNHVRRLRQGLGPAAGRLTTEPGGYRLELAQHELDASEFEHCCRAAFARPAEDRAGRRESLAGALGLWRGRPLADVESQVLRDTYLPHLEQLRLEALEARIDADLCLGADAGLVAELGELVREHPLREHLHAQLMLALARCGRRAEALSVYRGLYRNLIEELGVEPGAELRALHERVLAGEAVPTATVGSDRRPADAPADASPRTLPAAPSLFVGRAEETEALSALADGIRTETRTVGTVVISAVDGMAGVGKTALALHVAHQMAEHFPDGQLFVDLHGYTLGTSPRQPADVLADLLTLLGADPARIPAGLDARAAAYRHRLAERRALIVLDNAADEDQVRPLLPGASCLVLITSRRRLRALQDAHPLSLDVLSLAHAAELFRRAAGPDRIEDMKSAERIALLCGRLPLALRIAAGLLRHRPSWSVEHLAQRLAAARSPLAAFGEGGGGLGALFDLSLSALSPSVSRLFAPLGLVPGPDLDAYAASALLGDADPARATDLLEELVDHSLLIEPAPGRYCMHDLVRAHARTVAPHSGHGAAEDDPLTRLFDYYGYTGQLASVEVARAARRGPKRAAPANLPAVPEFESAWAWLRAERPNLEAAFEYAASIGDDEHVVALAEALAEVLNADGRRPRALATHQVAAAAAVRRGDRLAHADALVNLGRVQRSAGDLPGAVMMLNQALEIYRDLGDSLGQANALTGLGAMWISAEGGIAEVERALTEALAIYRSLGDRRGQANALYDLGCTRYQGCDDKGAISALTQAAETYAEVGSLRGQTGALTNIGIIHYSAGNYTEATDALSATLQLSQAAHYPAGIAGAYYGLGLVQTKTGRPAHAADSLEKAIDIYTRLGYRPEEATAQTALGDALIHTERFIDAAQALTQAAQTQDEVGDQRGQANALSLLGLAHQHTGDYAAAAQAHTQAIRISRAVGVGAHEAGADTLNHYAAFLRETGDLAKALSIYQEALLLARKLQRPAAEAKSLEGMGRCLHATSEPSGARQHLAQALEIYQRLGQHTDVQRVQNHLTTLTCSGPPE